MVELSVELVNAQINNQGTLTIEDDVVFGQNCNFVGDGTYILSDINKIASYTNFIYYYKTKSKN